MSDDHEPRPTEWHWGPLHFDGLFGHHGPHLCFHRYPDPGSPEAEVDPAKDIIPLQDAPGGGRDAQEG